MVELPIDPSGSWFQFSTELDGVTYGFEFRWNEREECWYVTLRDGEGNALVSGRKVVLGSLFTKFRFNPGVMQKGDVYAVDNGETEGGAVDPGYADLGKRVSLLYASDEEIGLTTSVGTKRSSGLLASGA